MYELPEKLAEPLDLKRLARIDIDISRFPRAHDARYLSSPVYHGGRVYCLNSDGVLSVVDVEKRQVVYQELLDLDWMIVNGPGRGGVGASLALAGKYVYAFLEASPSRGRLEQMISCPVADGTRLYVRQTDRLYCLENKPALPGR